MINENQQTNDIVKESLKIVMPTWPLQNTVAVNPFWNFRDKSFFSTMQDFSKVFKRTFYMPASYYKECLENGKIDPGILKDILESYRGIDSSLPANVKDLLQKIPNNDSNYSFIHAVSEIEGIKENFHLFIIHEVGKYCAAYLDETQALASFPWKNKTFWDAWLESIQHDKSMQSIGIYEFKNIIYDQLKNLNSEQAISKMLEEMGIVHNKLKLLYMQSLAGSTIGWCSAFEHINWQKSLGYKTRENIQTQDILATRMAYDFSLFIYFKKNNKHLIENWLTTLIKNVESDYFATNYVVELFICQLSLERSYQFKIAKKLTNNLISISNNIKAQFVFCIDVRSEMLRRHIENIDSSMQTIGFAGFFGVPLDYKKLNESHVGHRLPVLLTPAIYVKEVSMTKLQKKGLSFIDTKWVFALFRSLRKNPFSSFLYVELFGGLYIEKMMRNFFYTMIDKFKGRKIPRRFNSKVLGPDSTSYNADGSIFNLEQKIERAYFVLKNMGLIGPFARLVYLVGHGSSTTNNAFGSSLDCGACGGHAGDINARFLANLLNDKQVRAGLAKKGIIIPDTTYFVSAIHETVTDEIFILNPESIPFDWQAEMKLISKLLEKASENTRKERQITLSMEKLPNPNNRSKNWSEVRPEWGLAGNASFIVAPRKRTVGINLHSRSFLHDYDCNQDELQEYKTLELIMTAPMIVTNWINFQYYASTVAPTIFGSGNKALHNLVDETGVLEGNGGDLKIGIPLQSIHDGFKFVHDPLRLSVFIEAPKQAIENIIKKHKMLNDLISNAWIHLLNIDPVTQEITTRLENGVYVDLFSINKA